MPLPGMVGDGADGLVGAAGMVGVPTTAVGTVVGAGTDGMTHGLALAMLGIPAIGGIHLTQSAAP